MGPMPLNHLEDTEVGRMMGQTCHFGLGRPVGKKKCGIPRKDLDLSRETWTQSYIITESET